MTLGKTLKKHREDAKLSMEQIANASGISQPYISQIENNKKRPSVAAIFKILKAMTDRIGVHELDQIVNIENGSASEDENFYRQTYFENLYNSLSTYLSKEEIVQILLYAKKDANPMDIDENYTFSTQIDLAQLLNIQFSDLSGVTVHGKKLSRKEFEFLQFVVAGISSLD
jgi:transcriptional regulator with XRE-family HTH domain